METFYPDTRWSLVAKARSDSNTQARRALNELCQTYWQPLFLSLRGTGLSTHDAEDRTQAFISRILESRSLETVEPDRGKLRAFLKASLYKFNQSEWRREYAQKRGGGKPSISIDQDLKEPPPAPGPDPLDDFDRQWALTLLKNVFRRLEARYVRKGKRDLYEVIKGCLEGDGKYDGGEEAANRLGMSTEGIRSAVFQIRRRFRDYVREEIADTCSSPEDVKEALAYLCRMLTTQEL